MLSSMPVSVDNWDVKSAFVDLRPVEYSSRVNGLVKRYTTGRYQLKLVLILALNCEICGEAETTLLSRQEA